jgi:hypothetical protein
MARHDKDPAIDEAIDHITSASDIISEMDNAKSLKAVKIEAQALLEAIESNLEDLEANQEDDPEDD